jgi:hypothetical protein
MPLAPLATRTGSSQLTDPDAAIAELAAQISQPGMSGVILYCSPAYDLTRLGAAIAAAFGETPVVGCTSAGQLTPTGFQRGGVTALSLASPALILTPHLLTPLTSARACAAALGDRLRARPPLPADWRSFGMVLIDGLSLAEERLASALYECLPDLPLFGGSAGDDLTFTRTAVYHGGQFHAGAAVLAVVDTLVPFNLFRFQHFEPTATSLVITDADPDRRVLREINGAPAALAYAAAVGVPVEQLDADVFARAPLLVNLGGEFYVRSIYKHDPRDHSLTLLCAIEDGLVVRLGRGTDIVAAATAALDEAVEVVPTEGGDPLILGCDCILRRLEFEHAQADDAMGALYAARNVFGFSTYGEQFRGVHINQTFTGIALGGRR